MLQLTVLPRPPHWVSERGDRGEKGGKSRPKTTAKGAGEGSEPLHTR